MVSEGCTLVDMTDLSNATIEELQAELYERTSGVVRVTLKQIANLARRAEILTKDLFQVPGLADYDIDNIRSAIDSITNEVGAALDEIEAH